MKKHNCIFFAAVLVVGLFMVTANAQASEAEAPMIHFSGLIEVGAVWQDIDYEVDPGEPEQVSDLCLTTVELHAEAELNEWVTGEALFLYEDFTLEDHETHVEVEEAIVTIGNTEEYPLYGATGKMIVPFGALLTHFPDDPLMNAPVTLVLGETIEKALLVGMEQAGFSVSAYVFNGEMDAFKEDNQIESYGLDANYSMSDESGFDLLVGGSYISNIGDSDGLEVLHDVYDAVVAATPATEAGLKDYVAGAAGYVHVGFAGFFVDGEYMTALDEFDTEGTTAAGATIIVEGQDKPAVWNVEAGYNLDWGHNLEIVVKYAGSNEAEALELPETRYGLCLNQDIFHDVVVSLGYLYDEFDEDEPGENKDSRNLAFAQLAIEF